MHILSNGLAIPTLLTKGSICRFIPSGDEAPGKVIRVTASGDQSVVFESDSPVT